MITWWSGFYCLTITFIVLMFVSIIIIIMPLYDQINVKNKYVYCRSIDSKVSELGKLAKLFFCQIIDEFLFGKKVENQTNFIMKG